MRVFNYTTKQRVLLHLMMHGEMPLHELMAPDIGGTSADRRLRDLRADGVPISYYHKKVNGQKTNTTIYKLDGAIPVDVKEQIFK